MPPRTYSRGHPIIFKDSNWVYEDTGNIHDDSRPCKKCGKMPCHDGIDPCIKPLVKALNAAGFETRASCCGHGEEPGYVVFSDGKEIIIPRSEEESIKMKLAVMKGGKIILKNYKDWIKEEYEKYYGEVWMGKD